jgi:hypothetical protein
MAGSSLARSADTFRQKNFPNSIFLILDQKVKTMSPTELLQSRTMYDGDVNDTESMQTTLSQYQTPAYIAK